MDMSSTTNSTTTTDNAFINGEQLNNDIVLIHDVVAIKNHDGFKIGKINDIHENYFTIQLFHYKLDIKCEKIAEDEILINFGNIGSNSIFDFDYNRQQRLFSKMSDMNVNSSSMLAILADVKRKEEIIINMESQIKIIMQKLLLINNWPETIKELVNDEVLDLNDMIRHIYDNIANIENNEKREILTKLIARILVNKNSLSYIEQRINMFKNDGITVQKEFTKMLIKEIGRLIEEANLGDITYAVIVQYSKLCNRMLDLYSEHQCIS